MFKQYSMYCPHTGVSAKTAFTKCRLAKLSVYKVQLFLKKIVVEDGVNRLKVAAIKWKCKLQRKKSTCNDLNGLCYRKILAPKIGVMPV